MRRVVAILVLIGLTVGSAFAYQYTVTDAPASLLPKGRIDPATFVSLQRKDFAAGAAEVHGVFMNPSRSSESRKPEDPLAIWPYPGHPAVQTVEILLAVVSRPVVLVLGARDSVHWKLSIPPDARVEKIIVQGQYQQFVSGVPAGTTLLNYFSRPQAGIEGLHFADTPSHLYVLYENIRRLTGRQPSTLQLPPRYQRVIVDGVTTVAQPPAETAFDPGRPVVIGLTPQSGSRAADELSVRFCCEQGYTTAKATRAFSRGRLYFEAAIALPGEGAGEQTNIGLLSVPPSESARLLERPGHLGGIGVPLLDRAVRAALRNKDVVGVAADLDAGRAFFHINGNWITGSPRESGKNPGRGVEIPRGEEYVAAVSLAPNLGLKGVTGLESWQLNFGALPFRYDLPDGYTAYQAHPGGIEAFTSMHNNRWREQQMRARSGIPEWGATPSGTGYQPIPPSSAPATPAKPDIAISAQAEIHAVGVYEGGPSGVAVKITRTGAPVVLLVMAYSAVVWRLDVGPGVVLEKVVAMGYEPPRLQGVPKGTEIVTWAREHREPRAFHYYGHRSGSGSVDRSPGHDEFERRVKALFGRAPSSFQGAYRAKSVVVDGVSRDLAAARSPEVTIRCGGTTIVCVPGEDRVHCGGREIPCR